MVARGTALVSAGATLIVPNPVTPVVSATAVTVAGASDVTAVAAGVTADYMEGKYLSALTKLGLQGFGKILSSTSTEIVKKISNVKSDTKKVIQTKVNAGIDAAKLGLERALGKNMDDVDKKIISRKTKKK